MAYALHLEEQSVLKLFKLERGATCLRTVHAQRYTAGELNATGACRACLLTAAALASNVVKKGQVRV